jgi:hypothetical protein
MTPEDRAAALQRLRDGYETHFAFFNEGKQMKVRDRTTVGLQLPSDVLQRFYVDTPRDWYPGL